MRIKHRKPKKEVYNPIPDWLQTIQLNSWEAELLISALLLYALFQVPDYLTVFFRKNIPDGNVLRFFTGILVDGIKLLRWGYIIHIIVRGIWVASVGFSFVFPYGIIKEKTRFKGRFKEELEKDTNLSGFVLTLEQLSSIIYGISFMLFGLLLGVFSYLFVFAVVTYYGIADAIADGRQWLLLLSSVFSLIYAFLGFLIFVDFITNGYFRREKSIAKWFYPMAKVFRLISFSILYRRSLMVLQTNLSLRWKQALPFILIAFVGSYQYLGEVYQDIEQNKYYAFEKNVVNPLYYESTREFDEYLMVTIPDQIIDRNALPIFLKDVGLYNKVYSFREGYVLGKNFSKLSPGEKVDFLGDYLRIAIDSIQVMPEVFMARQHPVSYRSGYQMIVDLKPYSRGSHTLYVGLDTAVMNDDQRKALKDEQIDLGIIPFYFDKP